MNWIRKRCEVEKKTLLIFKSIRIYREIEKKKGNADSVKKRNKTDVKYFGRTDVNAQRVAAFAESSSSS